MDRRELLRLGARSLIAAPALALAVPAAGYLFTGPAETAGRSEKVRLADVTALDGQVRRVDYEITMESGARRTRFVWAKRTGNDVVVFSPVCPHAGCLVNWHGDSAHFICPCHQSEFAADGRWLSGPSLANMTRLPAEVVDGAVWITVIV